MYYLLDIMHIISTLGYVIMYVLYTTHVFYHDLRILTGTIIHYNNRQVDTVTWHRVLVSSPGFIHNLHLHKLWAVQLSWLERRANNANVVCSTPTMVNVNILETSKILLVKKQVLYMNIDQKLWNKLHGPMYYKINKRPLPITGILLYTFEIHFLSWLFVNVSAPISDLNRSNTCTRVLYVGTPAHKFYMQVNIIFISRQYIDQTTLI